MRIIHCADIHLDSKMTTHFDSETAKKRRIEILETFCSMIQYAARHNVEAIIIAGDLFDTNKISALARNTVLSKIRENEQIDFYYLRGNHDLLSMDEENIPDNLHYFNDTWTTYRLGDGIVLNGVELNERNVQSIYETLMLNENDFNIVTLHGQESTYSVKDKTELININELRNKGIDYLALGHVHAYKKAQLDNRAVYCYPGCLEGRGFDECGVHGFVLIDVDSATKRFEHSFVPFAKRILYEVDINISDCLDEDEIEKQIRAEIESERYPFYERSLFKINLIGEVDVECEKDITYLQRRINNIVFYSKIKDYTEVKIYYEDFLQEESLKGEFVRSVFQDDSLSESDKKSIIRYGIRLIEGKEVD